MTFKELFDSALQIAQAEAPKYDMRSVRTVTFENAMYKVLQNVIDNIPWDSFYIRDSRSHDKASMLKVEKDSVQGLTSYYSFPVLSYKIQCKRVTQNNYGRDVNAYVAKGYSDVLFNGYSLEDSAKLMEADVEAFLTIMYEKDETVKKNNAIIDEHEKTATSVVSQYSDMIQDFFNGLAIFKDLPGETRAIINETMIKYTGYAILKNS